MCIVTGKSRDELLELHDWLIKMTPQGVVDRTTSYWRLWVAGTNINFGNMSPKVVELFKRSLLVVRTQIDNGGAIVAANDSDIMQFSRDTYSYVWPRDGALVADSLDLAGFSDLARWFYSFCGKVITDDGYFYHKYNPDGSVASSWHPWVQKNGTGDAHSGRRNRARGVGDVAALLPLPRHRIRPAVVGGRGAEGRRLHVPLPRRPHRPAAAQLRPVGRALGRARVYRGHRVRGLKAARNFAVCFGDRERAERYNRAAEEIKIGAAKYLWSEKAEPLRPPARPQKPAAPAR